MAKTPFGRRWHERVRPAVLRRAGYVCELGYPEICEGKATQAHHTVSWRYGSQYWFDLDNLQAACGPCNNAAGSPPPPDDSRVTWAQLLARPAEDYPGPSREW